MDNRDVPWSNVNGLPVGWGAVFQGKREFNADAPFSISQKGYWFHFAIPPPALVADKQNSLLGVFVLWEAGPALNHRLFIFGMDRIDFRCVKPSAIVNLGTLI
jgi:hypothetical protein